LLSFVHEAEEWTPFDDYVSSRGAFARVESLQETYALIGHHLSEVREEDTQTWETFNHFAWRDGVFLALLHSIGLLGSEPGARTFADEGRPLSPVHSERDPRQYQLTAGQLMQSTAHVVPDVAKELFI